MHVIQRIFLREQRKRGRKSNRDCEAYQAGAPQELGSAENGILPLNARNSAAWQTASDRLIRYSNSLEIRACKPGIPSHKSRALVGEW